MQAGKRDGLVHRREEGSSEEVIVTFLEVGQEEDSGVPFATVSSSFKSASGCTIVTQLQAERQEGVSPLRKGTWRYRVLEAWKEVSEVWQHRAPDQRLPQTSAICSERSASPSSEIGVPVLEEDIVRSDSEREE
ncbi:hypothetical protein Taro_010737 [Colocasia esculenta]|uniref:Uncharacterized protein n=1 Tax=Colocasia esculenta TaxID=4460 RepID=A0A843U8J5_COLES|nr:hypothetical protein [Colocasia esculenta]